MISHRRVQRGGSGGPDPPLLKSDDLFFREPRNIGPPLSKILDTPLYHKTNRQTEHAGTLGRLKNPKWTPNKTDKPKKTGLDKIFSGPK